MRELYIDYLFQKGYFVADKVPAVEIAETLFSLASMFNIEITSNQHLATVEMIKVASRNLGQNVPEPFYRGFPESVKKLSKAEFFYDQILHYVQTYYLGDFSERGHSVFEEDIRRKMFTEDTEIKSFAILTEQEALDLLKKYVEELLASSRPLSEQQYWLVLYYTTEYDYRIEKCACKDTAVQMLLDMRDMDYATLLSLSDVIRLLEYLLHNEYESVDIKKLNLINSDRVFLRNVINEIFLNGDCNIQTCYEKKKIWNGLLHHIHYKPINEKAKEFVDGIRGKENISAYSDFERYMALSDIQNAVRTLYKSKGSAAVLRRLNYILSRCKSEEDVSFVFEYIESSNIVVLIQLLLQYGNYEPTRPRTFKFSKFNQLKVHRENEEELQRKKSFVKKELAERVCAILREYLENACKGKLGKVHIDDKMKNIALPLQESTSMGGVGILPSGSRIPLDMSKKVRGFTYWEKVNDIDLSILGITEDGEQIEFSWRTMFENEYDGIYTSGDQTSGYDGGSEYYDVELRVFKANYPDIKYLVFCNNVFTRGATFNKCFCKAGYMLRDYDESGEVFEPKTVESSFMVTAESSFAYLFGIDVDKETFVWLNISTNSRQQVAGVSDACFLKDYMHITDVMNLYEFARMLSKEIVDDPCHADVIFSDEKIEGCDGKEIIRSCDFERILSLMNS